MATERCAGFGLALFLSDCRASAKSKHCVSHDSLLQGHTRSFRCQMAGCVGEHRRPLKISMAPGLPSGLTQVGHHTSTGPSDRLIASKNQLSSFDQGSPQLPSKGALQRRTHKPVKSRTLAACLLLHLFGFSGDLELITSRKGLLPRQHFGSSGKVCGMCDHRSSIAA